MDELVRNFIEKSKAEIRAKEEKQINDYLMANGLYREVGEREYTVAVNPSEDYKYYDKEKKMWYKVEKVPVHVSEDDLVELRAITDKVDNKADSSQLQDNILSIKNDIRFFKILAIIYLLLSAIIGIAIVS